MKLARGQAALGSDVQIWTHISSMPKPELSSAKLSCTGTEGTLPREKGEGASNEQEAVGD